MAYSAKSVRQPLPRGSVSTPAAATSGTSAQRRPNPAIDHSPRIVTQRRQLQGLFGGVVQRNGGGLLGGFSMGPDTGADNAGSFHLDEQRRQAEEAAERQRQAEAAAAERQRQRAAAIAAARQLITGNMQLSANRPAVLAEFGQLVAAAGPDASFEDLAYQAMNSVMGAQPGSVNADREQHGGALGHSRR